MLQANLDAFEDLVLPSVLRAVHGCRASSEQKRVVELYSGVGVIGLNAAVVKPCKVFCYDSNRFVEHVFDRYSIDGGAKLVSNIALCGSVEIGITIYLFPMIGFLQ